MMSRDLSGLNFSSFCVLSFFNYTSLGRWPFACSGSARVCAADHDYAAGIFGVVAGVAGVVDARGNGGRGEQSVAGAGTAECVARVECGSGPITKIRGGRRAGHGAG